MRFSYTKFRPSLFFDSLEGKYIQKPPSKQVLYRVKIWTKSMPNFFEPIINIQTNKTTLRLYIYMSDNLEFFKNMRIVKLNFQKSDPIFNHSRTGNKQMQILLILSVHGLSIQMLICDTFTYYSCSYQSWLRYVFGLTVKPINNSKFICKSTCFNLV